MSTWLWRGATIIIALLVCWLALRFMTSMPGHSWRGPHEPLSREEAVVRDALARHVEKLAGEIGERNVWHYAALEAAAKYVEETFGQLGYEPRGQSYQFEGKAVRNIEATVPGGSRGGEIVIFGAHYDSVLGSPGADDNASGVAALLELARLARGQRYARTVRFVTFVNEEPPFFLRGQMGSEVYAQGCAERRERVVAMLSLETLGYYSDQKGSQVYPPPFSLLYPDTGNFVAVVGNLGSRSLVRQVITAFRRSARFPSEGAAAPALIPGVGWSDHQSFWKQGYRAVMLTDTALYRYPYYHSLLDLPEKIHAERLARVVSGLAGVLADLALAESSVPR